MVIISQDTKTIVNFDNVIYIDIVGNTSIFVNTYGADFIIGEYETEERTKEVLEEIVDSYRTRYEVTGERYKTINFIYPPKVYEMPEE